MGRVLGEKKEGCLTTSFAASKGKKEKKEGKMRINSILEGAGTGKKKGKHTKRPAKPWMKKKAKKKSGICRIAQKRKKERTDIFSHKKGKKGKKAPAPALEKREGGAMKKKRKRVTAPPGPEKREKKKKGKKGGQAHQRLAQR